MLSDGALQEEIAFTRAPEALASRLLVERLRYGESLVVVGARRFNDTRGYGKTLTWHGTFTRGAAGDLACKAECDCPVDTENAAAAAGYSARDIELAPSVSLACGTAMPTSASRKVTVAQDMFVAADAVEFSWEIGLGRESIADALCRLLLPPTAPQASLGSAFQGGEESLVTRIPSPTSSLSAWALRLFPKPPTPLPMPCEQYAPKWVEREAAKATSAMELRWYDDEIPRPMLSGAWGAGAHAGARDLKCLILLVAAMATRRPLVQSLAADEQRATAEVVALQAWRDTATDIRAQHEPRVDRKNMSAVAHYCDFDHFARWVAAARVTVAELWAALTARSAPTVPVATVADVASAWTDGINGPAPSHCLRLRALGNKSEAAATAATLTPNLLAAVAAYPPDVLRIVRAAIEARRAKQYI